MCNFSSKVICDKNDEFGDIMCMALRYALGRRTYVTSEVSEFIIENELFINERIKDIMLQDLGEYFDKREKGYMRDDDCDYESWMNLQRFLMGE